MKKRKQKKSLFIVLSSIVVLTLATILVIIYNGVSFGWDKIGEILISPYAISIYVILGILLVFLFNLLIISWRKKEIE